MEKQNKETCLKCGEEFEDNYALKNELNKRIWCNKCVDIFTELEGGLK